MVAFSHLDGQQAFEEMKDDPKVQALIKLLGNKYTKVVAWSINVHAQHPDYATFRCLFDEESEARGYISFVPQHGNWIAGGSIIPAFQAKRIRETEERHSAKAKKTTQNKTTCRYMR